MTVTLDLDASRATVSAAGAVCRRERQLRLALAALIAHPRDADAWAAARASVRPSEELALRTDLELLESVAQSGDAGKGMGGSPRIPFTEEDPC
ncbi:hypothetical protein [Brachybacterium kimchii]|uniref:Uncharacterized protein n=1 Tax=Brachybacterium kimchii TaxID=2942909 RepID=A0ABY4NB92_9MICO|nr:hypothetical protein [Brachybacterium kimchii]UQN31813.1 hypothetical protein M4486_19680 [Brachybacterium kimchii]